MLIRYSLWNTFLSRYNHLEYKNLSNYVVKLVLIILDLKIHDFLQSCHDFLKICLPVFVLDLAVEFVHTGHVVDNE